MTLQLLLFSSMKSAAKPLLLAVILLAEGGLWGTLLGAPLPKGLPRGLEKPHRELVELTLPPSVDRLDWVPNHIKVLTAAGCTKIRSLKGLPDSLRELDVSYTDIQSLESAPSGLRVLDIRETRIEHLVGLPPKLESLKVANRNITRLGKLPPSLRELHLENTGIRDLTGIPSRLRALYVEGEGLENLDGLPETLQSLTLIATKVSSLKGLPPSLQKLELTNNRSLRFQATDLPPLLTWLNLDLDQPSPDMSGLNYLAWYSDRRASPKRSFPSFLSSLTLRVPGWTELPNFPRSLRALGLLSATLNPLGNLPTELEVLDLTGYSRIEIESLRYLTRLKRLEIDYSSLLKLPELPINLEGLVLSGTKIDDLRGLPPKLKELVFCESGFERLNGKKDLPSSLKRLDLCKSRSLENLSFLPDGLTYLNLGGTRISRLPKLGGALQELDVSNTRIVHLDPRNLPKKLATLTVSEGQLNSLAGLRSEIKTLRIVQQEIP